MPNPITLSARELRLAAFASTDPSYPNLRSLHISPTRIEVTDGYIAAWTVPVSNTLPPAAVLIPRDAALKGAAIAKANKPTGTATLEENTITGNGQSVSFQPDDRAFPSLEAITPKNEPILTMGFNPALLMAICTAAKDWRQGHGMLVLSFYGPDKPVLFSITDSKSALNGLLMPRRLPT